MNNAPIAIILAAGKGTRMKSNLPKVLHRIGGIPMVKRVVNTIKIVGIEKIFVVIGYNMELVKTCLADTKAEFIEQREQLGTAHAVLQTGDKLKDYEGNIFVMNGDSPLVKSESIKRILEEHELYKPAATILTSLMENPDGYGRIIRLNNQIDRIVEESQASPEEKKIKEINVGVYCFTSAYLFPVLENVEIDNVKGEMYLTDVVKIFRNNNLDIRGVSAESSEDAIGIDTLEKLQIAEKILRKRGVVRP